jgi:hypothetical protein
LNIITVPIESIGRWVAFSDLLQERNRKGRAHKYAVYLTEIYPGPDIAPNEHQSAENLIDEFDSTSICPMFKDNSEIKAHRQHRAGCTISSRDCIEAATEKRRAIHIDAKPRQVQLTIRNFHDMGRYEHFVR